MLHEVFTAFDEACDIHDVHKIETIGDAYLAATRCVEGESGAEPPRASALRLARLALQMPLLANSYTAPDGSRLRTRVGLHAGPATAGIGE